MYKRRDIQLNNLTSSFLTSSSVDMVSPLQLLAGTAIAASAFYGTDGAPRVRLYSQDLNGGIRESQWYNNTWGGGTSNNVIVNAKLYSPIAAVSLLNLKVGCFIIPSIDISLTWGMKAPYLLPFYRQCDSRTGSRWRVGWMVRDRLLQERFQNVPFISPRGCLHTT